MWHAFGSGALCLSQPDDAPLPQPCSLLTSSSTVVTSGPHTLSLTPPAMHLLCSGANEHGQLGLVDSTGGAPALSSPSTPLRSLPLAIAVRKVACGWSHTALLAVDGALFTCGSNREGQLGMGEAAQAGRARAPVRVPELSPVQDVACGGGHTVAVALGGARVWAWGRNRRGELCVDAAEAPSDGAGEALQRSAAEVRGVTLALASADETVLAVSCGWAFSSVATSGGRVLTWGENRDGQCGRPLRGGSAEEDGAAAVEDERRGGGAGGGGGSSTRATSARGAGRRSSYDTVKTPGPVQLPAGCLHATSVLSCGWSHVALIARAAAECASSLAPTPAAGGDARQLAAWIRPRPPTEARPFS